MAIYGKSSPPRGGAPQKFVTLFSAASGKRLSIKRDADATSSSTWLAVIGIAMLALLLLGAWQEANGASQRNEIRPEPWSSAGPTDAARP